MAGTDVSVPAFSLHRELELYVKAGLTPLEALQTATLTPARVMKLENEVGTIEPGKRADIIILDGNPLENISNVRKLKFVIAQGRLSEAMPIAQTDAEAIGLMMSGAFTPASPHAKSSSRRWASSTASPGRSTARPPPAHPATLATPRADGAREAPAGTARRAPAPRAPASARRP